MEVDNIEEERKRKKIEGYIDTFTLWPDFTVPGLSLRYCSVYVLPVLRMEIPASEILDVITSDKEVMFSLVLVS